MFNLIRRISYGVIPRPDRPWEEDATSNAPAPRRKRRLSSTERDIRDDSEEVARTKKARGDSHSPEATDVQQEGERETPLPQPEAETNEVKEVTRGVKEVVLGDENSEKPAEEAEELVPEVESSIAPESVPLPEGALDDDLEDAPSSPVSESEEGEDATSELVDKEEEAVDTSTEPQVEAVPTSESKTAPASEEKEKLDDLEASESTDATNESPKKQLSVAAQE